MKPLYILGVKTTPGCPEEIHEEITRLIRRGDQGFVLSANVHGLNLAHWNHWLCEFYNQADLVPVDGSGIVLGARLLGHKIPKRLTWADWGWQLSKYFAEKNHSTFLLGARPGIAEQAAARLKKHAPGLRILGTHHGHFEKHGPENDAVIEKINDVEPDVLIVCFGMPLQEKWILQNHSRINARVFMVAGAALDYLSGSVRRCPRCMGEAGLEWLYRLLLEPRRMAKRYLWGNNVFIFNVLRQRLGLLSV